MKLVFNNTMLINFFNKLYSNSKTLPTFVNIKQTKTDIMKAVKLTQEEVIKRSVEKLLEVKEDPYCTFWGFFKMDVKSKNVNRLELKSNEYYILRGERVFGVN